MYSNCSCRVQLPSVHSSGETAVAHKDTDEIRPGLLYVERNFSESAASRYMLRGYLAAETWTWEPEVTNMHTAHS